MYFILFYFKRSFQKIKWEKMKWETDRSPLCLKSDTGSACRDCDQGHGGAHQSPSRPAACTASSNPSLPAARGVCMLRASRGPHSWEPPPLHNARHAGSLEDGWSALKRSRRHPRVAGTARGRPRPRHGEVLRLGARRAAPVVLRGVSGEGCAGSERLSGLRGSAALRDCAPGLCFVDSHRHPCRGGFPFSQ